MAIGSGCWPMTRSEHPRGAAAGRVGPGDLVAAARIGRGRAAATRSTSMSAAPPTGCRAGGSGPALMREPGAGGRLHGGHGRGGEGPGDREVPDRGGRPGAGAEPVPAGGPLCAQAGVKLLRSMPARRLAEGLSPKENRDVPPLDYPAGLPPEARAAGPRPSSSTAGSPPWTRRRRTWSRSTG